MTLRRPPSRALGPLVVVLVAGLLALPPAGAAPRAPEHEFDQRMLFSQGEYPLPHAALDPLRGYALFVTETYPWSIIRVRLSDFARAGSLVIDPLIGLPRSIAIDPAGGHAYIGLWGTRSILRIRLDDFRLAGTLTPEPNEGNLVTAVVDSGAGYGYFGTGGSPARIVKIRLSDFTRVSAITLAAGEGPLESATLDPVGGFGYFGTATSPARIVRVRLSDFTRVDSLPLNAGENRIAAALVDGNAGYAYFGVDGSQRGIVKVRLSDFTRVATLPTTAVTAGQVDPGAGLAYFAGGSNVIALRLGDFAISTTLSLPGYSIQSALVPPAGGFAYFGADATTSGTSAVLQVRVPALEQAGTLTLHRGEEGYPLSGVADLAAGYAYFGTVGSPAYVVKVDLPGFTRVDSLELLAEDGFYPGAAVIDPQGGYAYVGTDTRIVRIRLADFSRIDHVALPSGQWVAAAVIDGAGEFAYFGTERYPQAAQIVKVRLADSTVAATLPLNANETYADAAAIDATAGYAYFATSPRKIIRIRLSDFTRVGELLLTDTAIRRIDAAAVDEAAGYAYFAADAVGGSELLRVRLADFTEAGSVVLPFGGVDILLLDPLSGLAYTGEAYGTGAAAEIRLSDLTVVHVVSLAEFGDGSIFAGVIDPAARRAYFASNHDGLGVLWSFRLPDITPTPPPTPTTTATPTATASATPTAPATEPASPTATRPATTTSTPPAVTATATVPVTPPATATATTAAPTATATEPALRPRFFLPLMLASASAAEP